MNYSSLGLQFALYENIRALLGEGEEEAWQTRARGVGWWLFRVLFEKRERKEKKRRKNSSVGGGGAEVQVPSTEYEYTVLPHHHPTQDVD